MHVKKVTIENFKVIKNLEENINGKSMILIADNMIGKSSFMQAIQIALGSSEIPNKPVTKGKDTGKIEVITEGKEGEYTFVVKLDKDRKPVVTVTAPNGLRDNRKSIIGSIVGEIDFDLHEFVNLSKTSAGKKKQVEIIKSFLPVEIKTKLEEYESSVTVAFDERTDLNRQVKQLKGFISESGLETEDFETYKEPVDTEALQAEYLEGQTLNTEIDNVKIRISDRNETIVDKKQELERIKQAIEELKEKNKLATKYLNEHKLVDIEPIKIKISTAEVHNLKHQKVVDYKGKQIAIDKLEEQAGDQTALIESSRQAIQDTVREMKLPIKDLTFSEDALLYKGHEVDINTLATSEIMHLGIQLKMAKNPNAKVLFIENGQSLGTEMLKQIQELCKKYDYQIFMEQVERGTSELKIEIMPKY